MHKEDKLIGEAYGQMTGAIIAEAEEGALESLMGSAEAEIDELIGKIIASIPQADDSDPKQLNFRRKVGDLMIEKIYRDLMHINSTTGYKHGGRVLGSSSESSFNNPDPLDERPNP